ncbi:MAG: hypothetical protein LBG59_04615 [Candidatus Peribacteria bacterium]|nr:hypothetical protein [Candidatus Peribacteria bacterium]
MPTKQINQIPALQKLSCITEKHVQEMSFYNFIRHLRNALSHDHIKVEKQSNNHL